MDRRETTIPRAFFDAVRAHPERIAIADGDRRVSYSALEERARRAAAAFRAAGIGRGNRVAIWMPNSVEWVEAALGALALGAILVPLNTRLRSSEAAYILGRSRARALIAADGFLGTDYLGLLRGADLPDLVWRVRSGYGPEERSEWHQAKAAASDDEATEAGPEPDDLAEVMFTSGTTGFPKGAMLRHGQIVRAYDFYATRAAIRAGDRYLVIAPMFHSFGFKAGVLASILRGATIHPVQTFDAAATLDAIERERITVMGGPPTIFSSLLDLNRAAGRDISSIRSVVTGASMVAPSLIRALQDEVGIETVVNAYGLTEACALVTMTGPEDDVDHIAGTSGKAIDGVEMRCVGADGRPAPAGEPGEIELRGYTVMRGYFEDAGETAKTLRPDGWLRTGDVGAIDADGYLRVTDRLKDMFIVGGFNCYPAEIERLIMEHPAVREVAVIGVPDARLGEVGKAFVAPKEGASLEPEAFIGWCRERMANFKAPREVEIVSALPRNAMGKVQKFLLRDEGGR